VDQNSELLMQKMMAYVNIDAIVGPWYPNDLSIGVAASPILANVFKNALELLPSPSSTQNTSDLFNGEFEVLGDGSDYCSFINRVGIPSLNIEFGSPNNGGSQYHSRYDSFYTVEKIVDPEWKVHQASVSLIGLIMYDLAGKAEVDFALPFALAQFAEYKRKILEQFPLLNGADFSDFDAKLSQLSAASQKTDYASPEVQKVLLKFEQFFLDDAGIPGRPYFRHVMQAPDVLNDYGSQVFPAVAYYARLNDLPGANAAIANIADRCATLSSQLKAKTNTVTLVLIALAVVLVVSILVVVAIVVVVRRRRRRYQVVGDEM
jgi:N-acetylated-alpha-linked acidic dipeptidase